MAPHLEDHPPQNVTLQTFIHYVQAHGIEVHPSIEPYRFLRHGSGVRAASALEVRKNMPFFPSLPNLYPFGLLG